MSAASAGITALRAALDGVHGVALQEDAPLRERTTLKVGGSAAALVTVEHADALSAVAAACHDLGLPVLVLGRGSNLLIADEGWPGVVLLLGRGFRGVQVEGADVIAGAAEPMPVLARTVAAHGLGGLAFGVAIPGSLGGAVRMNAGAHGRELRDILRWADAVRLDKGGVVERYTMEDLRMTYRHSELSAHAVVVRAGLRLEPASQDELRAQMSEMKQWRREHQPVNEPSCGSVFRNPAGDAAGRLIEQAGMKGFTVGGATVSERHANFITVAPGATARDVYDVIHTVRDAVLRSSGVQLQTEVVLAGFADGGGA